VGSWRCDVRNDVWAITFLLNEHEKLFEMILQCTLRFPSRLSPDAKSVLSGLLSKNPLNRLGGGPEDYCEIQATEFFRNVEWDKLYRKEIEPPFKPQLSDELDTQYFDTEFTRSAVQLTPPSSSARHLDTLDETDELDNFVQFSFHRDDDTSSLIENSKSEPMEE